MIIALCLIIVALLITPPVVLVLAFKGIHA
jgi:hypothetical protein